MALLEVDFVVIGAGIAGAAAAYELSAHGRVAIVEKEEVAGYHATGRSAAVFNESYGHHPGVRLLSRGSRAFFEAPPPGFSEQPLLAPRGQLLIARAGLEARLDDSQRDLAGIVRRLSPAEIVALVPALKSEWLAGGLYEAGSRDIDVHALHHGFLRAARARGASLWTSSEVERLEYQAGRWRAVTSRGELSAPIVVNAAGAWGDEVAARAAVRPQGLVAKRRSAFTFSAAGINEPVAWPMVIDIEERFYFKPESGRFLASPANQEPTPPHDARPEELDIATALARLADCSSLVVDRVHRKWAGLRTFAPERGIVAGFAPFAPGFFWLVGQGGSGIKTAPAAGRLAASLIVDGAVPADLAALGLTATMTAALS